MGPFDQWPSGWGSSTSTGSSAARRTSGIPALYEGTTPVEPTESPEEGYHLNEDLADKAIRCIRQQKSLMPDKPFFVYFAPGATHAPHHVPKEWADSYRGQFDHGWDGLREETFDRQKELGVIPPDADLTVRTGDPGVGRHRRGDEAGAAPTDGGLRRVPVAHRPPSRPADRHARGPRDPRRHPDLRSSATTARRPRVAAGHVQRDGHPRRLRRPGNGRVHVVADRQVRRPRGLQPLRRRLGPRHEHAVSVDQAGCLALGRYPQRHHRPLAQRDHREGRAAPPVPSRHRRRARPCSRSPGCPQPRRSTACCRSRSRA